MGIVPKPSFRPLFAIATTREGSGVVLVHDEPDDGLGQGAKQEPPDGGPEAPEPCFWWRRGRVELPVQKIP